MQKDNRQIKSIIKQAIFNRYKIMNEQFPIQVGNIFTDQHIIGTCWEAMENRADYQEVVQELIKQKFFVHQEATVSKVAGYGITALGIQVALNNLN